MNLSLDPADIAAIESRQDDSSQLNGRLAYREPAAAALLDVPVHRLRDARLRGEIVASKLGKSYLYQREELLDYLRRNRQT